MNYIYDILLNFNEVYFDSFDWNPEDAILKVRKIPYIRISSEDLLNIRNYRVKFDMDQFLKYKNKTYFYNEDEREKYEFSILLTDTKSALAIGIKNGKVYKSSILISEEDEVISLAIRKIEEKISYEVFEKNTSYELKTRKEVEKKDYTISQIKKIIDNNELEKAKYLYYECFNINSTNDGLAMSQLKKNIEQDNDYVIDKLYDVLKLIEIKN